MFHLRDKAEISVVIDGICLIYHILTLSVLKTFKWSIESGVGWTHH